MELTCRSCAFEGKTSNDMKNHMKEKCGFNCNKCGYIAARVDELRQHEQAVHLEVKVNLHKNMPILINCSKCEFKCKYNIQLNQHNKNVHEKNLDKKYKCNYCSFESEFLIRMYEHRLNDHPEEQIDFMPNKTTAKDMIINLIAEQNIEIIQEFESMTKGLKDSFVQLTHDIRTSVENASKSVVTELKERIDRLEKKESTDKVPKETPKDNKPTASTSSTFTSSSPSPVSGTSSNTRKTAFLRKPKILLIGDSIAHNSNFRS